MSGMFGPRRPAGFMLPAGLRERAVYPRAIAPPARGGGVPVVAPGAAAGTPPAGLAGKLGLAGSILLDNDGSGGRLRWPPIVQPVPMAAPPPPDADAGAGAAPASVPAAPPPPFLPPDRVAPDRVAPAPVPPGWPAPLPFWVARQTRAPS